MPSFFFPILAHITESTALKGREQTLFSSEPIKAITNLSGELAHWGFVSPRRGRRRVCTSLNHSIFAACLLCQPRCDLVGMSVSLI